MIRLTRNSRKELDIPEKFFKRVVKTAFGMRRKTLRNSLKGMNNEYNYVLAEHYATDRPEQLNVEQFLEIARGLYAAKEAMD